MMVYELPEPEKNELPSQYAERMGHWYSTKMPEGKRGQVFTP